LGRTPKKPKRKASWRARGDDSVPHGKISLAEQIGHKPIALVLLMRISDEGALNEVEDMKPR
jgi:hypothetical protein